jgi:hypothetical protein
MSETIQAQAGNTDPRLLCEFDGRVLELWSAPSARYLASHLVLQKRKDEKDGGVTLFVLPGRGSRLELYFGPDEVANMEKLVGALVEAGMTNGM